MSTRFAIRGDRPPLRRRLSIGLALALGAAGPCLAASAPDDPLSHFFRAARDGDWGRHFNPENFARFEARLRARRPGVASVSRPLAPETQVVSNCNDSGSGSLRNAVAAAANGDTVDMSSLACSVISTSSEIAVHVDSLSIVGRGQGSLTIDGGNAHGVFMHYGTGTLAISDVTIAHGRYGLGGCVVSLGSVSLARATVTECTATGYAGYSDGGGVFATGNFTMTSSTLSNNDAYDASFSGARVYGAGAFVHGNATITGSTLRVNNATSGGAYVGGGGIIVGGTLTMTNSTLSRNTVIDVIGIDAIAGGAISVGDLTATGCTIEGNHASIGGGISGGAATSTVTLVNSTITGNDAAVAGALVSLAPLHLRNSTVAFNYAGGGTGAAGVVVAVNSEIQSSIVADNYVGAGCTFRCRPYGAPSAIDGADGADLSSNGNVVVISGANNLIIDVDPAITLPGGTLRIEPMLASFLENNGGPTQTLALNPNSPAINAGNNAAGLTTDQRGSGFVRVSGAAPDIGAFEVQGGGGDEIFRSGFE